MAINAPIQGTQADLIKIAMRKNNENIHMMLQVHDELVFEVKDKYISEAVKRFKEIMEGVLAPSVSRGVPIVAEANVGENWGEMEHYG